MKRNQSENRPRIRNKGLRRVRIADLEEAPWNHRTHPAEQAAALDGAMDELGYYGYPDAYETPEGGLRLIDGHLRKSRLIAKYGSDTEIEVNVTDFDDAQAKKANLTKDPLAAMAESNSERLEALLIECQTGNEALAGMLAELAEQPRPLEFEVPPESVQDNADELTKINRLHGNEVVVAKNDTERYLIIVYSSRQAKEAALKRLGLPTDERYVPAGSVTIKSRGLIAPSGKSAADANKSGACG